MHLMQLPLFALAALYILSLESDQMYMAAIALVAALAIPMVALRFVVMQLAFEMRRLTTKHSKTYFLQGEKIQLEILLSTLQRNRPAYPPNLPQWE